jgi:hypothetical protein
MLPRVVPKDMDSIRPGSMDFNELSPRVSQNSVGGFKSPELF